MLKSKRLRRNDLNWLVIGLGNPGERFELTRHNTGFWMAEDLSKSLGFFFQKPWFKPLLWSGKPSAVSSFCIVKPLTFMNRSGEVLPFLMRKTMIPPERTLILVDQMDLPPGQLRLKKKGSAAGHNGLKSIESFLQTKDYPRLYIGVGRPKEDRTVVEHVLDAPLEQEGLRILHSIGAAVEILKQLPQQGIDNIIPKINAIK